MRGHRLVGALAVAVALLGACGGTDADSDPAIPQNGLAELTKQKLANTAGPEPESVECDGDLPATVGIKRRCVLTTPEGTRYGVTVTATKVNGDQIDFEAVVDDKPMRPAG
ncbi:DUF4333 domain-containing protein [Mycobacterium koreense]|uniref:Uncharacterized protein n=1 Tax=Mycolicibacillus koreensis TaxID=1069220 RepID=A0A7I7SEW2_9MYCO|nr:DUF4333 domain-containing protein [Mycolicibacillus koreensis]MCV7248513.1 DUF4333 domain-containing protein [Mycolicibacillus koreensis]ODR11778.1 hypothetical protein BHQ15_00845 [Mycolicibacillus koreensis]OSC32691.1 hypothetical protein B8W67_14395 [Mycolicibacillus koreensis]BBY55472.1 hypothetical protein MKOR_27230 [Mycolicibacillus koreensis]